MTTTNSNWKTRFRKILNKIPVKPKNIKHVLSALKEGEELIATEIEKAEKNGIKKTINYVVDKLEKKGSGGGNWRRLINQMREK